MSGSEVTAVRQRPAVACYVDTDMVHSAYAVAGLIDLAAASAIRLEFRAPPRPAGAPPGPFTLWLEIRPANNADAVRVCCDFHDSAAYLCPASWAACDLYYKANCAASTYAQIPAAESDRLRPFGPYTPCRSEADRAFWLRAWGNLYAHARWRFRGSKKHYAWTSHPPFLAHQALRWRRYGSRALVRGLEHPPNHHSEPAAGPIVFFNPTCWKETDSAVEAINQFRAAVICGLREALGPRFAGGFRSNALAQLRYPAALEERPYSYADYLASLQSIPIAIYTNGLSQCFSWRLIEVFAASRAIVSEMIVNQAEFAFDRQAGIVPCATADEMVDQVVRLADAPDDIAALGQRSWLTYTRHLRPATRMRRLIEHVLECALSPATTAPPSSASQ